MKFRELKTIWVLGQETVPAFHIDTRSKYTILFSHGNAEDLGARANRTPHFFFQCILFFIDAWLTTALRSEIASYCGTLESFEQTCVFPQREFDIDLGSGKATNVVR